MYIKTHLKHLLPPTKTGAGLLRVFDKSSKASPSPSRPSAPVRDFDQNHRQSQRESGRENSERSKRVQYSQDQNTAASSRVDTETGKGVLRGGTEKSSREMSQDIWVKSDRSSPNRRQVQDPNASNNNCNATPVLSHWYVDSNNIPFVTLVLT